MVSSIDSPARPCVPAASPIHSRVAKVGRSHRLLTIHYDGVPVGSYAADLLVEKTVLVELKAVTALDTIHRAQCINYLKGSGLRLCLLLNFGSPRLEMKRVVNDA
nr:GxxExxY protein [uncultured Rhodopila sp.]